MADKSITVVGGGLAGCECAWQIAKAGLTVHLYEMRPQVKTGAHHTDNLSELVCSNSLGSSDLGSASGLLKAEMKLLGSKIMECAWQSRVPAGAALAVDREHFARLVTESISNHPLIKLHREEMKSIPESDITVIATGPLTSDSLSAAVIEYTAQSALHFFDAAAPILTRESVNMDIAYEKSRYDKGDGVYLNCPMNKEEYTRFWEALVAAEKVERKDFEKNTPYFESCLPVEVIASRGFDTLRFGPMKPVGLEDPRTNKRAFAVVQLRQDNATADLYNIVGFQTNLKWPEQKRVFKLIPGLENAEFVRLGVMHRNTYLCSPNILTRQLNSKKNPELFFAGQLTGVEGYSESTAMGLVAGKNVARLALGMDLLDFPPETMIGALCRYITTAEPAHFQPINSNWGIIAPDPDYQSKDKKKKRENLANRAQQTLLEFLKHHEEQVPASISQ